MITVEIVEISLKRRSQRKRCMAAAGCNIHVLWNCVIATLFEVSKDEQNYNLACEHCSLVKKLLGGEEFCYCLVVLTRKVISFKVNERMY